MADSRRPSAGRRPKVPAVGVESRPGLGDAPDVGIERSSSAAGLSALLGDSQVVSRFNRAQQIKVVQQLQQTQGNREVSRALAPESSDTGTIARATIQRQPPPGQNQGFVPEMSVKPDAAEINVGQVHTERLAVLNATKAPAQTTFHWGGAVSDSPALAFIDINPKNGPQANMQVQGRAPGVETLNATVEHQVPGGPPVDTQGPSPRITVKTPGIVSKVTYREAAAGPGAGNPNDPTRLSVGDTLVVKWTFSNVEGVSDHRIGSAVAFAAKDKSLVEGDESWNGNTFQQKFQATAVGTANVNVAFQFGDMTQSQAIKDTVQAHVEMPKGDFLAKTGEATAMIQTADQKATAWMDSLAAAYSDAWTNHTGALKHQADNERLVGELILGAALAFVPGGIGGIIGKTMANATKAEAFICDGIKDLEKWGFRNAAPSLLKGAGGGGGNGLTAYPTDPFMWDKLRGIRIHSELGVASARNEAWIHAVNSNDPNFTADFDPAEVMKQALTIDGTDLHSVTPVDLKQQSLEFEKGFWAKWLETYGYILTGPNFSQAGVTYGTVNNVGKAVKDRCEAVGLDITPYVEKSKQAADAEARKRSMVVGQPH